MPSARQIEMGRIFLGPPPLPFVYKFEVRFFLNAADRSTFAFGDIFFTDPVPLPAATFADITVGGADGVWPDPLKITPRAWDDAA